MLFNFVWSASVNVLLLDAASTLAAIVLAETLFRSSLASGLPAAVEPSCTTAVSLVVSIVTSPSAPVKLLCSEVVPLLNFNNFAIYKVPKSSCKFVPSIVPMFDKMLF